MVPTKSLPDKDIDIFFVFFPLSFPDLVFDVFEMGIVPRGRYLDQPPKSEL